MVRDLCLYPAVGVSAPLQLFPFNNQVAVNISSAPPPLQSDMINPISQWVSISLPPRGRKEGVVLRPMLLKAILKPIKVMITCKILSPYLKNWQFL